ncbi:hypothetical protein KKB55_07015 [Myxococcota bacterium]|nr:hypothetical protein [Myxococcota bacterium]MBU1897506.1 hypothetical protein [Myxococcota bacterium]
MIYSNQLALGTAFFELAAAAWALNGPGRRAVVRPAAGILILLAGYQLMEVLVCAQPTNLTLARMAFADITWLPAMGVLLIARLIEGEEGRLNRFAQGMLSLAAALTLWILTDPLFVRGATCKAVFAFYAHPTPFYFGYGAYYQFGLAAMLVMAAYGMAKLDDKHTRLHLADVQVGTMAFLIPAMIYEIVALKAQGALPSVMCHFAIFLAVFITRLIARERQAYEGVVHSEARL